MEKLQIKAEDITEEMILDLVNYFDTWKLPTWMTRSKIRTTYWRLRARWNTIDKAEEIIKQEQDKKQEDYKWRVINEIQQGIQDMKNANWGTWHYVYEIANIKEWEKWRTMQLGFIDTDPQTNKTKWRHSVEIEERRNPSFFQEMLNKYISKEEETYQEKPF